MDFMRANLQFSYSWSIYRDDDPRRTGKPDSVELDRHEGYEVLLFISRFLTDREPWISGGTAAAVHIAQKVERMIRAAPPHIRQREQLSQWVCANWKVY